jgi:transketolase
VITKVSEMRKALIDMLLAEAKQDPNFVFMTGDLGFNVVEPLQAFLGERFINAGVAEQNMMTIAGSLAASGLRPYVYSIAPFVTARCFEQIRNDIAYPKRAVGIIGAGAGLSYGSLGPTHHSLDDASLLATVPGMMILSPANAAELNAVHALAVRQQRPFYVRVPREDGVECPALSFNELGATVRQIRDGEKLILLASGPAVAAACMAADALALQGYQARVVSLPLVLPYPAEAVARLIGTRPVVTVFEGYVGNPLDAGTRRVVMELNPRVRYLEIAVPLAYPKAVARTETLRTEFAIDAKAITARVGAWMRAKPWEMGVGSVA